MPVPIPQAPEIPTLFPTLSKQQIDAARTSEWYDTFEDVTIPGVVIDLEKLGEKEAFIEWLESDSIFLPENSEGGASGEASTSRAGNSPEEGEETAPVYKLPKLNGAIRSAISKYGGSVFPKLNWTSPRDAAFILPQGSHGPCFCQSPSDVYLLLKSSDFISHDSDPSRAYSSGSSRSDGERNAEGEVQEVGMRIELVLKKFISIQPSREFRCFVRRRKLLAISQRDSNYYDYLQPEETRSQICETIKEFWEDEIWDNYAGGDDYVFDIYLSEDLSKCTIVDFNLFRPSTDPLLWTYEDLFGILISSDHIFEGMDEPAMKLPCIGIIDSKSHPSANSANPAYGTNMMPMELVEMSQGRTLDDLRGDWEEAVQRSMAAGDGSDDD